MVRVLVRADADTAAHGGDCVAVHRDDCGPDLDRPPQSRVVRPAHGCARLRAGSNRDGGAGSRPDALYGVCLSFFDTRTWDAGGLGSAAAIRGRRALSLRAKPDYPPC